jgi:hypothetical protein
MMTTLALVTAFATALFAPADVSAEAPAPAAPAAPASLDSPVPVVPAPVPEPPPAPATCAPPCSPGFSCRNGTCASNCNPACPRGEYCTERRLCAPVFAAAPAPVATVQPADARERELVTEAVLTYRGQKARIERRVIPRLSLSAGLLVETLGKSEAMHLNGGALRLGLRKFFVRWFGIQLAVGGIVAELDAANAYVVHGSDRVYGALADATAFVIFGRFYMGPLFSLNRRVLRGDGVSYLYGERDDLIRPRAWQAAAGGNMGLLLLKDEQLDFNLQLGALFPQGGSHLLLSAGYQLPLDVF